MEFHQHIKTSIGEIWIVDAFANGFSKTGIETRQAFEARVLHEMMEVIIGNVEIDHEPNGAPFIKKRPDLHLSISHSHNWFAIYISEIQAVGIDIEIDSLQIEKTKKYFLTKSEIERLQPNNQVLKTCWGIKESVIKLLKGNVKSLMNDIEILTIKEDDAQAKFQDETINLKHQQIEDFMLVYTNGAGLRVPQSS